MTSLSAILFDLHELQTNLWLQIRNSEQQTSFSWLPTFKIKVWFKEPCVNINVYSLGFPCGKMVLLSTTCLPVGFFFFPFYFQKAVREKRDQPVKHNKNRSPQKRMKLKKKKEKTVEKNIWYIQQHTSFWCCSTSESFPQTGQNKWQNMCSFRVRQRRF